MEAKQPAPENAGYQGWANYPTWNVLLWLTNEEGLYNAARGVIADAGDASQAASDLKEWVEGGNPLASQASLYSDILSWALGCVDWQEVANAFVEDEGGGGV